MSCRQQLQMSEAPPAPANADSMDKLTFAAAISFLPKSGQAMYS